MDWEAEKNRLLAGFQQVETAVANALAAREQIRGALAYVEAKAKEAADAAAKAAADALVGSTDLDAWKP